jgi:type II secretory ATPase GspE/PulE/Tfp pilus assembly ATPase PilB-like protein
VLDKPFGNVTDTRVDVRISFIVSGFGETIVMRLLNQSATSLDINTLGIRQQNLDKIMQIVKKPYGIIFNTGPTGSGKTTTLYSLLSHLNKSDIKIITVEDPIEYQVAGILQTQVDEKNDYTFATALRALLRQNPDIMMIGEIRDEETAQIAVQAALTGHLILSTLHTNSSAISIQRLMNMGVSPEDMATAANAFMAQRLVRKLCEHCKKSDAPTKEEKAIIKSVVDTISDKSGVSIPPATTIYRTVGCDKCSSGYKGRTVISEVLVVDNEIQEMIANGELSIHIVAKAIEKGMITMTQDGIVKVLEGATTLAEVQRITEL